MTSLLFVSDRNIQNPTGERTLIMDRASTLFSEFGVSTDIRLIRPEFGAAGQKVSLPLPMGVSLESLSYKHPLGLRRQMRRILSEIDMKNPAHVVFSGAIVSHWAGAFSRAGHNVCIDVHGDIDEWVEHPPAILGKRSIGRAIGPLMRNISIRSVKSADAAFVVSRRTANWAHTLGVDHVFRVPCCTTAIPTRDEWERNRSEYRARLNIPDGATVWMYSGGTSGWQMLPETIALAKKISELDSNAVFVFATSAGEKLFAELGIETPGEQFRLVRFQADEVVDALCAADVGLMLRSDSRTNNAAFPNKFSEYLAAGLFVVTGEGLTDPAILITDHEVGLVLNEGDFRSPSQGLVHQIIRAQVDSADCLWDRTRSALNEINMQNTLRTYVEYLNTI